MGQPITYFEITSRNAPELHTFYRELFGWSIQESQEEGYATVATADGSISGGIAHIPDNIPSSLTVFVQVDDLQAAIERAGSLGGSLMFPPMHLPNGSEIAMITDPAGTNIGLMKG